jgi:hypothetical protein
MPSQEAPDNEPLTSSTHTIHHLLALNVMTEEVDAKCYAGTSSALANGQISSLEFFQRTLQHLGPSRAHHPEDDRPIVKKSLRHLFRKGRFGPVAASIRLCESDGLTDAVNRKCS